MTTHELKLGDLVLGVIEVNDQRYAGLADFLKDQEQVANYMTLELETPQIEQTWHDGPYRTFKSSETLHMTARVTLRRTKERKYREVAE